MDAKVVKDEQKQHLDSARSRPQTSVYVPDNGFITLEVFQNKTGAGKRAWLDPDPAAERGDWLRGLIRASRGGASCIQGVEIRWGD